MFVTLVGNRRLNEMPVIMCSFCEYLGQNINDTLEDRWERVLKHEETCSENPKNW